MRVALVADTGGPTVEDMDSASIIALVAIGASVVTSVTVP